MFLADEMNYRIKEVPIEWYYVETRRVSPIKDSINGFLDLGKISRNKFTGKYKL